MLLLLLAGVALVGLLGLAFLNYRGRKTLELEMAVLEERIRSLLPWEARASELQHLLQALEAEKARLQAELHYAHQETALQIKALEAAEEKFVQTFKALSGDALAQNNRSFLELAQSIFSKTQQAASADLAARQQAIDASLKPVKEALSSMGEQIQHIEKSRIDAYAGLRQQVQDLLHSQKELRGETTQLVKALRAPAARGRWGEIQLRRVVEMAGMINHCDFEEQVHHRGEEGALRPDMIVNLPGGKQIIVDAKTPLSAYLDALEAPDEITRQQKLTEHAAQVRTHVQQLSTKSYWSQFKQSPEFVVLFLPGESFFSAALEYDPSLIEMGVQAHVLIATPTTLIALLRSAAYGWQQEKIAESAQEISRLGQELFKRLSDMGGHINRVGRHLGAAVDAYNQTVGTLERRVMVSARRFQDLGAASVHLPLAELQVLDHAPRLIPHEIVETDTLYDSNETSAETPLAL